MSNKLYTKILFGKQFALAKTQKYSLRPDAMLDSSSVQKRRPDAHPMFTSYTQQTHNLDRRDVMCANLAKPKMERGLCYTFEVFRKLVSVVHRQKCNTFKGECLRLVSVHIFLLNFTEAFRRFLIDYSNSRLSQLSKTTLSLQSTSVSKYSFVGR